MMDLRSWRLGWLFGCLGLGLSLLVGCDSTHEEADGISRVRFVIDTEALSRVGQTRTAAQARGQMPPPPPPPPVPPLAISRIFIEVLLPEDPMPVTATVHDVMGPEVSVDLEVPQGMGRQIRVEVFNPFDAVIFAGGTVADLFLPVHDIELILQPIFSVNVALETQVSAAAGAELTVVSEEAGLLDLILSIPPETLAGDAAIIVGTRNHPGLLPPIPPDVIPMGPVLAFESNGVALLGPITLTLPYDEFGLSSLGLGTEALRFYHLDMGMSSWSEASIVNVDPNMVTITVDLPGFGSGVLGAFNPPL